MRGIRARLKPMATLPFRHQRRVTYSECTVGNHVYYGRYLDILEEARAEMFRAAGVSFQAMQDQGVIFPVVECRLLYKAPARYDDVLTIEVWLVEVSRLRMEFGYRIFRTDGTLVLQGSTQHVATGLDEKPKRMVPELFAKLEPFILQQV
jgi:acyl-CoA thioester hydrolase